MTTPNTSDPPKPNKFRHFGWPGIVLAIVLILIGLGIISGPSRHRGLEYILSNHVIPAAFGLWLLGKAIRLARGGKAYIAWKKEQREANRFDEED